MVVQIALPSFVHNARLAYDGKFQVHIFNTVGYEMMKIVNVVGARPNLMKIAPLMA